MIPNPSFGDPMPARTATAEDRLRKLLGDNLLTQEPLRLHTSFRIGGPADFYFDARTPDALVQALRAAHEIGLPVFLLGGGSNLLVSDGQTNQVKRYDSGTGAFIDVFASANLAGPTGMTIHQGVLYVTNSNPPQGVQKFDATTGVNTGNFVPSLANSSPRDVKVNPANNRLYVLYYNAATVETFDLTTMASFGLLMPAGSPLGSGGLYNNQKNPSNPTAVADKPVGEWNHFDILMVGDRVQVKYTEDDGRFVAHQISILGLKSP